MAYHWTLHIDAPPEKVFETLTDVEHHPEWANEKAKLTMSPVSGGPPALGATYRSQQVFAGKPQTADIEIVQFDRPSRFAFAISQRKEGGGKEVHYTRSSCGPRAAAPGWSVRPTATATRSSASWRSPRS